jgi:glycosyltransferase involved in cell wall biosynthesis
VNICLISREYPPFFGGGIGSYTERFARALAGAGHRAVVVTVSDDGEERREERDGVAVVRLPFVAGDGRGGFDWSGPHAAVATDATRAAFCQFHPVSVFAMGVAAALPRIVREFGIEAIEAPDTGALAWFVLNARRNGAAWAKGLPPVTTVVHSPTEWIAEWNRRPLKGRAERELAAMEGEQARWSDAVVSPSAALGAWAVERWGVARERVLVCPYALGELEGMSDVGCRMLDVKAESGAAEHSTSDIRNPTSPRVVLFLGRLEARKGVDALVEAFGSLAGEEIEAVGHRRDACATRSGSTELWLVGEDVVGPGGARFGAAAVSGLGDGVRGRVKLLGKRSPSEVGGMLDAAAVVAVPAPMDNFPFTCVEAMARGKVVVGGNAGGVGEMIEDGRSGILFAPGDAGACAAALGGALAMSDAERAAMGREAARRIQEICGNERVVARRVELYGASGRGRVLKPAPGRAGSPGDDVVVVGGEAEPCGELIQAVRDGDSVEFAHGWTSNGGRVRVFSTPTLASLARGAREIGPIAVTREALERGRATGAAADASSWELALALCAAGCRGAVVPECVTEAAPGPSEATALEELTKRIETLERGVREWSWRAERAEAELARIRSSRGWAVLQRLYGVLHVLRGRGFGTRPRYDRAGTEATESGGRGRKQIA